MNTENREPSPRQVVVMGVSGAGKSEIAGLLADSLGLVFTDGDDLHSPENIQKMSAGIALSDDDRWPWLDLCSDALDNPRGSVVACSALKKSYRDRIRSKAPATVFIHLHGDYDTLLSRMRERSGHYMKPEMLVSQLEALEELEQDETGLKFDIADTRDQILSEALYFLEKLWSSSS